MYTDLIISNYVINIILAMARQKRNSPQSDGRDPSCADMIAIEDVDSSRPGMSEAEARSSRRSSIVSNNMSVLSKYIEEPATMVR